MEHLYEKALESAEYIKTHTKKRPKIAVVLGSGLGKLTADFTDTEELSYKDIPNFPVSTVAGHKGALLAGKLGDTEVYAMEGRFHFYEGYSMKEVCYPFYVFKLLDVEKVVLTNACGGINREFAPGTLMLITDFINMMGTNPLIGPNDERFGPRFPDMTEPYSLELRNLAKQTADVFAIKCCNCTGLRIVGSCLDSTIVINLVFVIIVVIIATTGDNTMVNTNDATDICYTADITIYPVHQGGVADIRATGIYTYNTAGAVFLPAAGSRSIAMHLALIFHVDIGNIRTVFTDDAASTTSQSNNGTGVDNTYALFVSTGNGHFIFADNTTDIVLADNKAFIAVAHAQKLAYLAVFTCVSADNAAYIGSLLSVHSGSVGRIGDDAHVFTGNAAEELRIICNIRAAL